MNERLKKAALIGTALFLLWRPIRMLLSVILLSNYFVDEIDAVQAAQKLWTRGLYGYGWGVQPRTQLPLAPELSIGPASSWASGLGWIWGGSLLHSRLASALYCFCLLSILTGVVLYRFFPRWRSTWSWILGSAVTWNLTIKFVPYVTQGIAQSLGEFSAACWLGLGFCFLEARPTIAALLLGVSVWLGKVIYFPFAITALLVYSPRSVAVFLIPRIAFLIYAALWAKGMFGEFLLRTFAHFHQDRSGLMGAPQVRGLHERLSQLEWSTYTRDLKARILQLILVPIGLYFSRMTWRIGRFFRETRSFLFPTGLIACLLVFSAWYFLWVDMMWLRRFQPALFVGFGMTVYFIFKSLHDWHPLRGRFFGLAIVGLLSILDARWTFQNGLPTRESLKPVVYLEKCRTDEPRKKGPMEIPDCVLGKDWESVVTEQLEFIR